MVVALLMLFEPTGTASIERIVRRSRFIAAVGPAASRADVEDAINHAASMHPGADHIVYAFLLGDPASEIAGMSDAGEPKGTAGRPVMEILRGSGIRDVVITIVRYFGGTRLGTGGLVHAYGDATRGALEALPVRTRIERVTLSVRLPYGLHQRARQVITSAGATIINEVFDESVSLTWEMAAGERPALERALADLSRGSVVVEE